MPGDDRTGPMGNGPMTGRAAGFCAGYPTAGYMNAGCRGVGFGFGGRGRGFRGRGRGWAMGAGYAVSPMPMQPETTEQELSRLQQQAEMLGESLDQINQRIERLKK